MYHKKRVICCDKSGKIVATLTLSGDDGEVKVKISCFEDIDEVFLVGRNAEKSFALPLNNAIFPYNGGKVGCVLLKKGRVIAVSKGEMEHCTLLNALEKYNFKKDSATRAKQKPNLNQASTQKQNEVVLAPQSFEEENPVSYATTKEEERQPSKMVEEPVEACPSKSEPGKEEREVAHFYCSIKKNLDETFTCYPNVKLLEDMIPYSTWVEIKKENTPYVVGLIKEADTPKYVCYGVASDNGHKPPDDIAKYCQWLPTDEYNGYWIIFQDADNGETLQNDQL